MLRPSTTHLAAILALSLCGSLSALAQDVGYGAEIDRAEEQLDADIKACKPIDPASYVQLAEHVDRVFQSWKNGGSYGGAPVDVDKILADRKRAFALAERAKAAAACKAGGTTPIDVATKVEPPKLSPVTPTGDYKPSIQTVENSGPDYVGMFRVALARYLDAKKRCDGPGMMAARAEMDAAQGAAREILAKEKVLGGKSELLKQMAEQRQAAENGTISMCPRLPATLAHMLSEPPRVSSEPISDEPSTAHALVNARTSLPALADPALADRAHVVCSGPSLGDLGKLPTVPPGVIPGSPGAEAAGRLGYGRSVESAGSDARPDEEPRIHIGVKYTFDGHPICPVYQETKVPPPELPSKELFGPVPTGNIDPDYSGPIQIDITPKVEEPPEPPK